MRAAREGCQLLSRSHPLVVELADFVAERALSGLEPELAARASVIRTKAVAKRTQVLVLRLRHQLHQERWTGKGYEPLPDLLVEECLTARVNGDGLEPLEGAAALELLEAPASGNVDPGQRQQWLQEAVAETRCPAASSVGPGPAARPAGGRRSPPRARGLAALRRIAADALPL